MTNERSQRLEQRAQKTRAAAHERVIKDATVQFRLDAETMERLLTLADQRRTGVGVLARMWVLERLNEEGAVELASAERQTEISVGRQLIELQKQVALLTEQVQAVLPKSKKASAR